MNESTRRRAWLGVGRALGAVVLAWVDVNAATNPFGIGPYVQATGPGEITVKWESVDHSVAIVRFGSDDRLDQELEGVQPRELPAFRSTSRTNFVGFITNGVTYLRTNVVTTYRTNLFYVYQATLTNLSAGVSYAYQVELEGVKTPLRHFKTVPAADQFARFIVYGDSRSNPRLHAALTRQFRGYSPDFILHTGDLVARGTDHALWAKELFRPLAEVINEVPFCPVMGNHEQDGTNYLAFFGQPGGPTWYSFDAGPVHVLGLDFRFEKANQPQYRFASEDLQRSQAPWKIVVLHYPLFNIGGHSTGWGHAAYLPLFHQTKVDLVLAGHSHIYERFRPVLAGPATTPDRDWPITCLTTGGGGASLYTVVDHPALFAHASTNHFVSFEANRDTLLAQAIALDGQVIDRFKLTKQNGQYPAEFLAQAYPETALKLFFDAAPNLAGNLAGLPTPTQAVPVMFTILPRQRSPLPADLQISLAPASAPYYVLEGGPVPAVLPGPGKTNTVWASIRASGKRRITAAGEGPLKPALFFQATVRNAEGQTVADGQPSRRSKVAEAAAQERAR